MEKKVPVVNTTQSLSGYTVYSGTERRVHWYQVWCVFYSALLAFACLLNTPHELQ